MQPIHANEYAGFHIQDARPCGNAPSVLLVNGKWPALRLSFRKYGIDMTNQKDMRTSRRVTCMRSDKVIAKLFLPLKACGEAKGLKTLLQIGPDSINAWLGICARVDIHNGFQVIKILLHKLFGLPNNLTGIHTTPPNVGAGLVPARYQAQQP